MGNSCRCSQGGIGQPDGGSSDFDEAIGSGVETRTTAKHDIEQRSLEVDRKVVSAKQSGIRLECCCDELNGSSSGQQQHTKTSSTRKDVGRGKLAATTETREESSDDVWVRRRSRPMKKSDGLAGSWNKFRVLSPCATTVATPSALCRTKLVICGTRSARDGQPATSSCNFSPNDVVPSGWKIFGRPAKAPWGIVRRKRKRPRSSSSGIAAEQSPRPVRRRLSSEPDNYCHEARPCDPSLSAIVLTAALKDAMLVGGRLRIKPLGLVTSTELATWQHSRYSGEGNILPPLSKGIVTGMRAYRHSRCRFGRPSAVSVCPQCGLAVTDRQNHSAETVLEPNECTQSIGVARSSSQFSSKTLKAVNAASNRSKVLVSDMTEMPPFEDDTKHRSIDHHLSGTAIQEDKSGARQADPDALCTIASVDVQQASVEECSGASGYGDNESLWQQEEDCLAVDVDSMFCSLSGSQDTGAIEGTQYMHVEGDDAISLRPMNLSASNPPKSKSASGTSESHLSTPTESTGTSQRHLLLLKQNGGWKSARTNRRSGLPRCSRENSGQIPGRGCISARVGRGRLPGAQAVSCLFLSPVSSVSSCSPGLEVCSALSTGDSCGWSSDSTSPATIAATPSNDIWLVSSRRTLSASPFDQLAGAGPVEPVRSPAEDSSKSLPLGTPDLASTAAFHFNHSNDSLLPASSDSDSGTLGSQLRFYDAVDEGAVTTFESEPQLVSEAGTTEVVNSPPAFNRDCEAIGGCCIVGKALPENEDYYDDDAELATLSPPATDRQHYLRTRGWRLHCLNDEPSHVRRRDCCDQVGDESSALKEFACARPATYRAPLSSSRCGSQNQRSRNYVAARVPQQQLCIPKGAMSRAMLLASLEVSQCDDSRGKGGGADPEIIQRLSRASSIVF